MPGAVRVMGLSERSRNPLSPSYCRMVSKRSRRPVKSLWT
jgi:hypothetical protein